MEKENNKGLTLVEVLISILIFTFVLGALLNSLISALYLNNTAKEYTIATSHLRNMMEEIKVTPYVEMLSTFPDSLPDGPGNSYQSIVGGYQLLEEHITVTYADVNSDPLEINVELIWHNTRGRNYNTALSTFKTR